MPSRVPFSMVVLSLTGALSPTEYPLERIEKRLAGVEPRHEAASIFVDERIEQFGRQVARVLGEQRSLHPFHDLVASGQDMRIDDQAHLRLVKAALVEQPRVGVWRQDRLGPAPAAQ